MPGTWLYLHAMRHAWYTLLHLILKIHLFFTHLLLGGIRLLLVLHHVCCLFIWANSFLIASCHFVQEFALGWFQASMKVLGSSGTGLMSVVTIARSMKKFKFSMAFFSCNACQQFYWHHHYMKLGAFSFSWLIPLLH